MRRAAMVLALLAALCACDSNQSGGSNTDNQQDQLPLPSTSST